MRRGKLTRSGESYAMRVQPECISCLFERASFECDLAGMSSEEKRAALQEILSFVANHFSKSPVTAFIGTERERIIKRHSGKDDPYAELKRMSNEMALKILPAAEEFYNGAEDKIEAVIRIIAAGNSMEYGVKGHEYDHESFPDTFRSILNEKLIGDMRGIEEKIRDHDSILYLTDNCGEIVFDVFAVRKLRETGKKVIVSPKSGPIINDATVDDVLSLGEKPEDIVETSDYVGISLEEASQEFLDLLWNPEYLIIAKGMGHYETITEFDDKLLGRLIYIFRAKCASVSKSAGVQQGSLVAILKE